MATRIRGHLRSNVIGYIALFCFGIGGTAFAVDGPNPGTNTVGSEDIINQEIRSADIADGRVTAFDIAANHITKHHVKDESLTGAEIADDSLTGDDIDESTLNTPPPTEVGDPHWGVMNRNVFGSPDQDLRGGPFVQGPNGSPPFGEGSLSLVVNGMPRVAATTDAEGAAYGNEVDFAGDLVSDIEELGFHVFTTGENNAKGNPNMPNIKFEIDPNLDDPSTDGFSTLVYQPVNTTSNQWSGYIDATADGEDFFLTGAEATATGCTQANLCDLEEIQTALDDGGDPALIGTFFVGKGRDLAFSGSVDGLRLNDTVYDFEPLGVFEQSATP